MSTPEHWSRRAFIKSVTSVAVVGPVALISGCDSGSTQGRRLEFTSLEQAYAEAERLVATEISPSPPSWTLAQTLVHCAQSIEFSMSGFPQMKSSLFQNTVGRAAFNVFSWRGHMSHDLTEEIPGAPTLADETDVKGALRRLRQSVDAFQATSGPLQPHFAYGELRKPDYELAHAMHLANHFSAMPA
jgi:hypothetical protein